MPSSRDSCTATSARLRADRAKVSEALRQPNTDLFRRWEVAGASHSDFQMHRFRRPLQIRDLGIDLGPNGEALGCTLPLFSRIPFHYVMSAGYDALARWVMDGTPPPIGPDIAFSGTEIARDEHGNSLGGIRLSQHEVATATNTGQNAGPGLCPIRGSYVPFDDATLTYARKAGAHAHVKPGGHDAALWNAFTPKFLRFFAGACA